MLRFAFRRSKSSPRFFTQDWFTAHVPVWRDILAEFKGRPGIRAIEIGSYEGRSACWLLENILTGADSGLDCIDIFKHRPTPLPGAPDDALERFHANIAPWRERVTVHVGRSQAILRRIERQFDFAYIDGSHMAADALADAVLIWPLLKRGAVLIFDDYEWQDEPCAHQRPKIAIDSFLACYEGQHDVMSRDYQVFLRKTVN